MRSDLVTRETSGPASASSPDGPAARPSPAGGWPTRGSSPSPWAKPANAAGWRPCSPGGKPAGCSISGGNGCAGRARIAGRSGGTYVVGLGSWAAPGQTAHVGSDSVETPVRSSPKKTQGKKTAARPEGRRPSRRIPGRRRPAEENDIFTPARSLYFQDGHDKRSRIALSYCELWVSCAFRQAIRSDFPSWTSSVRIRSPAVSSTP